MKIAIFGIGGIGGYFGGRLANCYAGREDLQIDFIARGAMLEAIRRDGLTLLTPTETLKARPALATSEPVECGPLDLVFLCTKTYHLDDAARQLAPAVGPQTVIIPLLNGVDNAERLRAFLPQAQVLNGGIYISAAVVEPGVVRHISGTGRTVFGSESGNHQVYQPIEKLLRDAGIPAEYDANILAAVWEKYLFIEPIGSTTSFTQQTFGGVRDNPENWALVEGMLSELESVAAARGVPMAENIHQVTLDKYRSFDPATKTSMQVDFEKGRQTEIETFTGYVVRAARQLGIPAPLHEKVYEALKTRSTGANAFKK